MDAAAAAYEVHNLTRAISNLSMTNIRTVIGSLDLDEVLSNRDDINERLLRVIDAATQPWGVKVTRVEIKDLDPPADITEAMARQMKAEREKRANILEAEGFRQAEILKAEGEKRAAILSAEGRREAAFRDAEGEKQAAILASEGRKESAFRDAEARERAAQAEALATEVVSKAISEGDIQAINYFVALRYIDSLKEFANGRSQKILFLPLEASNVIGAIGGITEIAREAFGKNDGDSRSGPWDRGAGD